MVWRSLIHPTLQAPKNWFLQHLLVPCIQWPILIYGVPISLVSKLEQKASVYIWKWVKLHKSMTSLLFYSSASPCPLTVRSLTSVLKSSKISRHLLLKHSHDASISSCVPKLQAGNWQVEEAGRACETDLKHKSIIGHQPTAAMGWGILKLLKFHLTNLQEITGHLFPAITKKLRIGMPFPKQCS